MSKKIKKPKIFISHISEDASVALLMKKYLVQAFANALDIFVSSDGTSITLGDKWLNRIEETLLNSSVVVVLSSSNSIASPWINFEAGGAWIRGARVTPLCIKGMKVTDLPEPLKSLQACDITTTKRLVSFFESIANIYELKCTIQDWEEISTQFSSIKIDDVLDDIPSGIITVNTKGNITAFNRSAEMIPGLQANDMPGENIQRVGSVFADIFLKTIRDHRAYRRHEVVNPVTRAPLALWG